MAENACLNYSTRLTMSLYIAPKLDDGTFDPEYRGPLQAEVFATAINTDESIDYHKGRGCRGQIAAVYSNPAESNLNITFKGVSPIALLAHLLGEDEVIAITGAAVTSEPVSLGAKGHWIKLDHGHIATAGRDLQPSGGGASAVEGTDYEVNERLGLIKPLVDALANMDMEFSYTYQDVTGTRTNALRKSSFTVHVLGDAVNDADQKDWIIDGREIYMTPNGEVDWVSDDPINIPMTGRLVTRSGETTPLFFERIASVG